MDELELISDEEELPAGIKDRLQETSCVRITVTEHEVSTQVKCLQAKQSSSQKGIMSYLS
jgi:hypothetical protein